MFTPSMQRVAIHRWIAAQEKFPTRKQTVAEFKNFPQKVVRAAYQAARDKSKDEEVPSSD